MTTDTTTTVERHLDAADKAVTDLCQGRLRWEMRVPAEPDHDPDLVIGQALGDARRLLAVVRAAHKLELYRDGTAMRDLRAALAALDTEGEGLDDGYVTCGIDGCEFAVERGEGRTMALHQSEAHPR